MHAKGNNLYPSYHKVLAAKKECIPNSIVSDYQAEVELQDLMDHTAKRLMKVSEMPDGAELQLLSKVGFDGSSGQSVYKQACGDEERNLKIEENLFLTWMVPIQIKDVKTGNVLWTNAKTSSTLYTHPVSFKYCKENKVNIDEFIEIRLLQKN